MDHRRISLGIGLCQMGDEILRILPVFKAVFFIEGRGIGIDALLLHMPLRIKAALVPGTGTKASDHPVKRSFYKAADLPLPLYHHAQNAGHDPAHRDDAAIHLQIIPDAVSVFQRQCSGKIDTHQVIFLGPQKGSGSQMIVFPVILCFFDAPDDLFLGLGIDPDTALVLTPDPCLHGHQTVNILTLSSGVGTDVDILHLRTGQNALYDLKLLLYPVDDLIAVFIRNKGDGGERPFLIFLIVGIRITHGHQMPHAPGHDGIVCLHIAVPLPKRQG